jgi:hypothetical protein
MTSIRITICALLSGGSLLMSPAVAGAQEASGVSFTVRTVPGLEGIRFTLGDREFKSDEDGVASTTVPAVGTYDLRVSSPALVGEGRRAELIRWSDGVEGRRREITIAAPTEISAGFDVVYIVREEWRDANGEEVSPDLLDSFVVTDDSGETRTLSANKSGLQGPTAMLWQRHPAGTRWLVGSRLEHSSGSMTSREVAYRIEHASAGGNRIDASAAPFYPARTNSWLVDLFAYKVSLTTSGLLFGAPSDARLSVADFNGRTRWLGDPEGQTIVLPPGRYVAQADATGMALDSKFTLPGPARVEVKVVGPADLGGLGGLALALIACVAALWVVRLLRDRGAQDTGAKPESAAVGAKPFLLPNRELVRVHLDTGRLIEGWAEAGAGTGGVMILDVARVHDAAGEEVAPGPSDSFVLTARIKQLERLQAAPPPIPSGGDTTGGRPTSDGSMLGGVHTRGAAGRSQ